MKVFDKPANIIVPVLLFILLTPGLFVRLPQGEDKWTVAFVHALLFAAMYSTLLTLFPNYY